MRTVLFRMNGSIIVINIDIRETRVALIEKGVITELQIERASHRGTVGNVVLGKVTRVLPGMQAAFIDVGQERSAFLHVEDLIRPDDFDSYLAGGVQDQTESFRGTGKNKATQHRNEDEDPEPSGGSETYQARQTEESADEDAGAEDSTDAEEIDDSEILVSSVSFEDSEEDEPQLASPEPPIRRRRRLRKEVSEQEVSAEAEAPESEDEEAEGQEAAGGSEAFVEARAMEAEVADSTGALAFEKDDVAVEGGESSASESGAEVEADSGSGRGGRSRRGRGSLKGARSRRGRKRPGDETSEASASNSDNSRAAKPKLVRGRRSARGKGARRGETSTPARVTRSVPISEVVSEGDKVVVQISKEPIGTKGARVTSHVSLAGRYVVYLPTVDHLGISKRIGSARERSRLRKVMESLKPAHGGLIVRTVAEGLTKKQLKADVGYLMRVWADICKRRVGARCSDELYTELDLILKVARDLFTDEVKTIYIDDRDQYARLVRFVEMFLPERAKDIELYTEEEPIFDAYGIEDEIGRALSRKVPLPSGGSLIVDQAEALTAIDVNTGRYVGKGSKDLEETAMKTNLEAVEEIAYQLRFRNIGGLVILDLIDMEKYANRERVWRALEGALVKDKAKTTLNRISDLGLIEMTRKRTRESLGRILHEPCFYCDGTGQIQSKATIAYEILRQIGRERGSLPGYSVVVNAHPAIVDFLKHEDNEALEEAARRYARRIDLNERSEYHLEQYDLHGK